MREIKFRAWDEESKRMGMAIILHTDQSFNVVAAEVDFGGSVSESILSPIILQYTGLHDKNGKDLDWWEGEIFSDAGRLKVIVKDQGCFWFEDIKTNNRILCYEALEWADDIYKEGNVHQHPELLKEE